MASTSKAQSLDLDRILDERIDWRYKSFPEKPATTIRDVRKRGWNLLDGEFMFPTMVLKESALRHNVDEMAALCKRHEISLAPHGKTSRCSSTPAPGPSPLRRCGRSASGELSVLAG